MAGLLGKAAASNWKKATFGDKPKGQPAVDWRSLSLKIRRERESKEQDSNAALALADVDPLTSAEAMAEQDEAGDVMSLDPTSSCGAGRMYNPAKQRFLQVGSMAPGNVSRELLRELNQRSGIDSILGVRHAAQCTLGPADDECAEALASVDSASALEGCLSLAAAGHPCEPSDNRQLDASWPCKPVLSVWHHLGNLVWPVRNKSPAGGICWVTCTHASARCGPGSRQYFPKGTAMVCVPQVHRRGRAPPDCTAGHTRTHAS